jgi:topoisomerase IV subunit A
MARSKKALAIAQDQNISNLDLYDFSAEAMTTYGEKTLQDRAVVDFRDGLKPVQRRVLYATYKLGLLASKGITKKTARLVGEVLGKYHPHGDSSVAEAMTTMVSSLSQPMLYGEGNWGTLIDEAGATRYTECRLSEYSDKIFFDPFYWPTVEYVPNYDGTEKEPLYLPSLLPNMFINGIFGIAVGATSHLPAFSIPGLTKLLTKIFSGQTITAKECVNTLEFNYLYRGLPYDDPKNTMELMSTGSARLYFGSPYTWDNSEYTMTFQRFAPNIKLQGVLEKLPQLECVKMVEEPTSLETGLCYIIHLRKPSETGMTLEAMQHQVSSLFDTLLVYRCLVTERYLDTKADIVRARMLADNVPNLLTKWADWRLDLEKRALQYWLDETIKRLTHVKLLKLAVINREVIIKALDAKDSEAYLVAALDITKEQAETLMKLQLYRLKKMNLADLQKKIADLTETKQMYQMALKNPKQRIIDQLKTFAKIPRALPPHSQSVFNKNKVA